MVDENTIGKRIKQLRNEKGMTQADIYNLTGIPSNQLSGYENGKVPGLSNLAKIARALDTTIDNLYYGDSSISFITSAPDTGSAIVNCLIKLRREDVIGKAELMNRKTCQQFIDRGINTYMIPILNYQSEAVRLLDNFEEFQQKFDTFSNPEIFYRELKASIANEINNKNQARNVEPRQL